VPPAPGGMEPIQSVPPGGLGGENKVVRSAAKAKNRAYRQPAPKKAVFALVEHEGYVRSFHVANVTAKDRAPDHRPARLSQVAPDSPIYASPCTMHRLTGRAVSNHNRM
jgi:hypothetical protein